MVSVPPKLLPVLLKTRRPGPVLVTLAPVPDDCVTWPLIRKSPLVLYWATIISEPVPRRKPVELSCSITLRLPAFGVIRKQPLLKLRLRLLASMTQSILLELGVLTRMPLTVSVLLSRNADGAPEGLELTTSITVNVPDMLAELAPVPVAFGV